MYKKKIRQTFCFYFHFLFLFFGPKNDNAGSVDMFAEYGIKNILRGKRTSVKIRPSLKMRFKISTFCTNFVFLHSKNFKFLHCLGLTDMLSANQNAEIFACIPFNL